MSLMCPSCFVTFADDWETWYPPEGAFSRLEAEFCDAAARISGARAGGISRWLIRHTVCPQCLQAIFHLVERNARGDEIMTHAVFPRPSGPPVPDEVPTILASDYREACLVLADSEKASAALSRRCLQNLLREKGGVKPGSLDSEIQQVLDSGQLPSVLADAIDAVRQIGNFAAHPTKNKSTGEIV